VVRGAARDEARKVKVKRKKKRERIGEGGRKTGVENTANRAEKVGWKQDEHPTAPKLGKGDESIDAPDGEKY